MMEPVEIANPAIDDLEEPPTEEEFAQAHAEAAALRANLRLRPAAAASAAEPDYSADDSDEEIKGFEAEVQAADQPAVEGQPEVEVPHGQHHEPVDLEALETLLEQIMDQDDIDDAFVDEAPAESSGPGRFPTPVSSMPTPMSPAEPFGPSLFMTARTSSMPTPMSPPAPFGPSPVMTAPTSPMPTPMSPQAPMSSTPRTPLAAPLPVTPRMCTVPRSPAPSTPLSMMEASPNSAALTRVKFAPMVSYSSRGDEEMRRSRPENWFQTEFV